VGRCLFFEFLCGKLKFPKKTPVFGRNPGNNQFFTAKILDKLLEHFIKRCDNIEEAFSGLVPGTHVRICTLKGHCTLYWGLFSGNRVESTFGKIS